MDQTDNIESTPSTMGEKYPVGISVPRPEQSSRFLAILFLLFIIPKIIILIPHLIVLYFLNIAAFIAAIFAQIVVLFTGKYPKGLFDFIRGATQWKVRMQMYLLGLTDKYPPFNFD